VMAGHRPRLPASFVRRCPGCGGGIALRLRVEGGGAASGAEVHGAGAGAAVRSGGRGVHLHAAHRVGDRRPAGWAVAARAVAARAVVNVPAAGICRGAVRVASPVVCLGAMTGLRAALFCSVVAVPGSGLYPWRHAGHLGLGQRGGVIAAEPVGVADHRQGRGGAGLEPEGCRPPQR
jgi:hypothetical protein